MARDHHALLGFVAERRAMPFAWGSNDCASFAAAAVLALTGADPLSRFASSWSTERGAARVLRRHGGMRAAVSEVLDPIAPAAAQRGDVAGVPSPAGDLLLMIVEGATLVGPAANGVRRLPRSAMTFAWSAE